MNIGELFLDVGIIGDKTEVVAFNTTISALTDGFRLAKMAIDAAYTSIDNFIGDTIRGAVALTNFNQQTGLAISKLQQWQVAASKANVALGIDEVTGSISSLQSMLAQIKLGGGNVAPFQLLGIDIYNKDAFQVLEDIREQIKGLDDATAVNLIKQMGLTPGMINVLRLSREEFSALKADMFVDEAQVQSIQKAANAINILKLRIGFLKDQAVAKIAPLLEEKLQVFFKFLTDNSSSIISFLEMLLTLGIKFLSVILAIYESFSKMYDMASKFIIKTIGIKNAIIGLGIAISALAAGLMVAFAPFWAIAIGITLALATIYLFLDDIATWMRGGDSLFGDVYDWISNLTENITEMINKVLLFKDVMAKSIKGKLTWEEKERPDQVNLPDQKTDTQNKTEQFSPDTPDINLFHKMITPDYGPINKVSNMVPSVNTSSINNTTNKTVEITQNNDFKIQSSSENGKLIAMSLEPMLKNTVSELNNAGV